MLDKSSAAKYAQDHALNSAVNIDDLRFALQLVAFARMLQPEKVKWGVPLARVKPGWWNGYLPTRLLDPLIMLWGEHPDRCSESDELTTIDDLLTIIARWRLSIALGSRSWYEASMADLLRISTENADATMRREPSGDELAMVGTYPGLNIIELALSSRSVNVLSSVRMLALCAREWLEPDEFRQRFYPDSRLDAAVIMLLCRNVQRQMYSGPEIVGLFRPADQVAAALDDVEDIIFYLGGALRRTQYRIRKDCRQPDILVEGAVDGYWSLDCLVRFLELNVVSRI